VPDRYIFLLSKVDLPEEAPKTLDALFRAQIAKAVAAEPRLTASLPQDAPAYDVKAKGRYGNKAFHKYMAKHHLRAFKVTVQVTHYTPSLVPNDKKPGQVVGAAIVLRMFGETIPDRVMAFSGDGSSSVLVEIGKKERPGDREYADTEAITLAIDKAMAMSMTKLTAKLVVPKRKKRKRHRRKHHKKRATP